LRNQQSSRKQPNPVCVIGAGSWGTALAMLISRNGFTTMLWGQNRQRMQTLAEQRCNPFYLPNISFPKKLMVIDNFDDLAKHNPDYLISVPTHGFREILLKLKEHIPHDHRKVTLAWASKGFEPGNGMLLAEVVQDVLANSVTPAVVSGPSFAEEVAMQYPTALTVASADSEIATSVAGWLRNDKVRVYTSDDMAGVQLGGAIKNVIAIATGISDGLGYGANARAALITRGLAEMARLGKALGGRPETFMGLTGIGDLVLTCTDDKSRNRRVGLGLGSGKTIAQVVEEIGQEAEGINTARELHNIMRRQQIEMPITEQVYKVIFEGQPPGQAVDALLAREPRRE